MDIRLSPATVKGPSPFSHYLPCYYLVYVILMLYSTEVWAKGPRNPLMLDRDSNPPCVCSHHVL